MNENLASMAAEAMRSHEAKEERRKLRSWAHYALGAGCALALFIAAFNAVAAPMFKSSDGTVSLRLLDTPCSNEKVLFFIAQKVQPEFIAKFKDAVLTYGGRDWKSCWIEYQGHVFSMDEEGAPFQPIPLQYFKENTI
jgi:hypothetical protein